MGLRKSEQMYHFKWGLILAAAALKLHSWDLSAVTGFHLGMYGSQLELAPEFAKPLKIHLYLSHKWKRRDW